MSNAQVIPKNIITSFAVIGLLCAGWYWALAPLSAEAKHVYQERTLVEPLIAPPGVTATEEDPDTAFREADAGLSAWVRIDTPEGDGSQVALDIAEILEKLTTGPEEIRHTGRWDHC